MTVWYTHTHAGVPEELPPAKKPRLERQSPTTPTQPSVTIASLLHKKLPPTTAPSTSSTVAQALSMLTHALSANSTLLQSSAVAPAIVSGSQQPSLPGGLQQPSLPGGLQQPSLPGGSQQPSLPGGSQQPSLPGGSQQPSLPGGLQQPSLPGGLQQPSLPGGLQQPVASVIPSLMQSTPTSPTHNSKSFLLQLVQLYKHYQADGDSEGMDRIKKQLNVLVNATQGRSASNPLVGALSFLNTTATSTPQTSSVVGLTVTPSTGLSTGQTGLSTGQTGLSIGQTGLSTGQTGLTTSRPAVTQSNVPPSLLKATRAQTTPTVAKSMASQVNSSLAEQSELLFFTLHHTHTHTHTHIRTHMHTHTPHAHTHTHTRTRTYTHTHTHTHTHSICTAESSTTAPVNNGFLTSHQSS